MSETLARIEALEKSLAKVEELCHDQQRILLLHGAHLARIRNDKPEHYTQILAEMDEQIHRIRG